MSPGLDKGIENSWSLGLFASGASELEPAGAAERILGFVSDDGLVFRRGGSRYQSNTALGASGLLWVWDGWLGAVRRTVFASPTSSSVLTADDATPLTVVAIAAGVIRPVVVAGSLMLPTSPTTWSFYGGSLKAASYSTGTVTVTQDSTTVTGVGTSWLANVDAGMTLKIVGFNAIRTVSKVNSNASLELTVPWTASTTAGTTYLLSPVASTGYAPSLSSVTAAIQNRFVARDANDNAVLWFSAIINPQTIAASDFYRFQGQIIGLGVLRDVLLVFTTAGVYAVSNMAYDLVDASGNPQQRSELVNADLIAWGHEGIAPYSGALVVPALDNVWLMDNLSAPTPIADRILDLYLSYVRTSGYKPGVAEVYNGHYFLPILNGTTWVDTLVCRLKATHDGNNFAWTQLLGQGAEVSAFAERSGTNPPLLLGASRKTTSRVLDLSGYLNPTAATKNDADGTTPTFQLTTRNIPTGNQVVNSLHFIVLAYTLTDAASDNPVFTAEVNPDDAGWTTLTGNAPEAGPANAYTWPCSVAARHVRFRFTCTLPSSALKIESLAYFMRKSGLYT